MVVEKTREVATAPHRAGTELVMEVAMVLHRAGRGMVAALAAEVKAVRMVVVNLEEAALVVL